jgi:hypothetical protein
VATREERLAENEAIFREVNERVAEVSERFGLERVSAVCECARAGCTERFELGQSDYEEVRSSSALFAVVPGHETPDVETVVARRDGYLIVEKLGVGAEIADREDSREEPARGGST